MTHAPFTTDEIRAAEIEAAREEGYQSGMAQAARVADGMFRGEKWCGDCLYRGNVTRAIEAKAKEPDHAEV